MARVSVVESIKRMRYFMYPLSNNLLVIYKSEQVSVGILQMF